MQYLLSFVFKPLKITGDASSTATTEVFPKLEVDLYGVAGPYMEIIPYLTANSHSTFDAVIGGEKDYYWNCDLKTGVTSVIGAEVKVLCHSHH